MTEKGKMLLGKLYNASDIELSKQRILARQAADRFNRTDELEVSKRQEILENLLGSIGSGVEIYPNVRFDYGCNTYIGNNCYFNFNCIFLDCAEIHFGDNVFVGPNVLFLTPVHPLLSEERNRRVDNNGQIHLFEYCKPIKIESNVWIGGGAIVNPGITIGHDSVIGSGSVVTKDIPSGVIAAGVPCKVIRKVTQEDKNGLDNLK